MGFHDLAINDTKTLLFFQFNNVNGSIPLKETKRTNTNKTNKLKLKFKTEDWRLKIEIGLIPNCEHVDGWNLC